MPWRSIVVAVVVALTGCSPAAPPVGSTPDATGASNGAAAPNFSVETFDGETFALAEKRGTPVVINFWESW